MDPITEIWILLERADYVGMKVTGKRGCEFDSLQAGISDRSQQTGEGSGSRMLFHACLQAWPVTIYVLPNEMDLLIAKLPQTIYLVNNLLHTATSLTSSRIRNNTERTKFVATFNYRNESYVRRVTFDW